MNADAQSSPAQRLRSKLIDLASYLLNLAAKIGYKEPRHPIGWKDHLRWCLESIFGALFHWAWCGSDDEIHPQTLRFVPPRYMTQRQLHTVMRLGAVHEAHCPNCTWRGHWTGARQDCVVCGEPIYLDLPPATDTEPKT